MTHQLVHEVIFGDMLQWVKDDGVMGNNQLCAALDGLCDDLGGAVERQQCALDGAMAVADQNTGVVKIHAQ